MGVLDARGRGQPEAAAPLALGRQSVAGGPRTRRTNSDDAGIDSAARTTSQHAAVGEEGNSSTSELPVFFDLSSVEQRGGASRRRPRGSPGHAWEKVGEGDVPTLFHGGP